MVERPDKALDSNLAPFLEALLGLLLGGSSIGFEHALLEHLDGARHIADLISAIGILQLGRQVVFSQPAHHLGEPPDRRADTPMNDQESHDRHRQRHQHHGAVQRQAARSTTHLTAAAGHHLGQSGVDDVDADAELRGVELLQLPYGKTRLLAVAQRLDHLLLTSDQSQRRRLL